MRLFQIENGMESGIKSNSQIRLRVQQNRLYNIYLYFGYDKELRPQMYIMDITSYRLYSKYRKFTFSFPLSSLLHFASSLLYSKLQYLYKRTSILSPSDLYNSCCKISHIFYLLKNADAQLAHLQCREMVNTHTNSNYDDTKETNHIVFTIRYRAIYSLKRLTISLLVTHCF